MGIDPRQYLVLPRFIGAVTSVFALLVVFDVVAIFAGFAAASLSGMTGARYTQIVLQSLSAGDVWLTVGKALSFGLIAGIVPSYFGISVRRAATEVPIAVSRATVASIVGVFLCSALFVAIG
jgi:phospholipid/cholesterol/gamma-HCH transport system permease protein